MDAFMIRRSVREPKPFRIEGVKTVLTPEPDDAELAAQALLGLLANPEKTASRREKSGKPEKGSAEYYRALSRKIQDSHAAEARLATRYVAYAEQELNTGGTPPSELEKELYRRIDIIDREGGELKRRWQHCLAECIVRQTVNNPPDKTM